MEIPKTSPEKFKSELTTAVWRGEAVLIHKDVDDQTFEKVMNILRERRLDDIFKETISIDQLMDKNFSELSELAKKPIIITGINLEDKNQDGILAHFRAAKNHAQVNRESLNQLLIIKPGTSENVPSWHACFNWTRNI